MSGNSSESSAPLFTPDGEDNWRLANSNSSVEIEHKSYVSYNVYDPRTGYCIVSLDVEEVARILEFMKERQRDIEGYREWIEQGRQHGWY